jgi:hypothetical protein
MKTAIVPAEITSVEDRVAGSLSMSQLLLLAMPVFGGSLIYVLLPPLLSGSSFKIALIAALAAVFGILAIRIKDQLLLFRLIVLIRYNLRPRFYIFNKNDLYLRATPKSVPEEAPAKETTPVKQKESATELQLDIADVVKLEQLMANPEANVRFVTNRKGELSVRLNQVK